MTSPSALDIRASPPEPPAGGPLYLGVDGGATSCRARLEDADGRTLGEGRAGSANPRWGFEAAMHELLAATRAALAAAGLDDGALGRIHAGLGLAGTGQAVERNRVLGWRHPFAAMALQTDAHVACLGAHGGRDGAILIVGTGSCGCALVGGRETRVGGWGFPASDHGSGAWLGLEAVRRSLLAHDGAAPRTPLAERVLDRFDRDPEAIVAFSATAHPRDWASFAPLVLDAAAERDPLGRALLAEAARDLAAMIDALRATGAQRLCLMGGLAAALAVWLPPPHRRRLAEPEGDALAGALLLARRRAGAPA